MTAEGGGREEKKKKRERKEKGEILCVMSHAWLTSLTPSCISQLCPTAADVEAA